MCKIGDQVNLNTQDGVTKQVVAVKGRGKEAKAAGINKEKVYA